MSQENPSNNSRHDAAQSDKQGDTETKTMTHDSDSPPEENDTDADSSEENCATTTNAVADEVEQVQQAIDDLEDDVPPDIYRRIDHSEKAVEKIEDWADGADPNDIEALVGAKTIIDAEQTRAAALRKEVPDGNIDLLRKFEELEDRLDDVEDIVDPLSLTNTAHIVYVNSQFVGRYTTDNVSVENLLTDANKEDPSELGLFPLDDLIGDRQHEQAFPADENLDLSDENRTFFESTSDGGKIAHE